MAARLVLSAVVLALVGGGAGLTLTGNVVLILVGVLLVLFGAIFAGVSVSLLRDPEAAAKKLLARRAELEQRAGHVTASAEATEPVAAEAAVVAVPTEQAVPTAAANRLQRRAAERAGKSKGRQRRAPRR